MRLCTTSRSGAYIFLRLHILPVLHVLLSLQRKIIIPVSAACAIMSA